LAYCTPLHNYRDGITISASVNPIQVNTSTTASANFTDPGVLDTHTASWNWGDGNTTTGTVTETNGSGSVSDSHTYTSAGVYPITLTVTDKDGGTGTQTFQYLSVYNPTPQGLFSAGQKYTSPAGAYLQNTSLTGTVHFGLSYKYQGTVPTGNRQFSLDFNAANLHFNATTINSLVISNGIGTLTGTGTLTGSSSTYNFLVTGSESANTIRIQIKDTSGNVIYDTQPGASDTATPTTTVTAGNVLAH
jgi:PKD repeat protein